MKPIIVLLSVFLVASFVLKLATQNYALLLSAKIAMCAMLCFTAIGHFAFTKGMRMMIPSIVPFKTEIVYLTGILEITLGIGLLIPSLGVYVGWGLIMFFILLVPANVYAAIHQVDYQKGSYGGKGISYLWFRIPLQMLFMVWVYLSTIKKW
jgi:uncharacterized membrane protein